MTKGTFSLGKPAQHCGCAIQLCVAVSVLPPAQCEDEVCKHSVKRGEDEVCQHCDSQRNSEDEV